MNIRTIGFGGAIQSQKMQLNRSIHCMKTRNGAGHGLTIGYDFHGPSLLFEEKGLIYRGKDPNAYLAPQQSNPTHHETEQEGLF
jgi:hypothetical protein